MGYWLGAENCIPLNIHLRRADAPPFRASINAGCLAMGVRVNIPLDGIRRSSMRQGAASRNSLLAISGGASKARAAIQIVTDQGFVLRCGRRLRALCVLGRNFLILTSCTRCRRYSVNDAVSSLNHSSQKHPRFR
jgi:hypothetical protein